MNDIKMADLLDQAPNNLTIVDALGKCLQQVKNHERIMVSVSGGADSDAMLDLIIRVGGKDKAVFVFHNTGLEYDATKRQLRHLEEKYGIEIQINPPVKPIPLCVREHGVPFWSKYVAEMIERLQRHGFQWEDEPLEVLLTKYPRCVSALKWWCNEWKMENGKSGRLNIDWVQGLKEFLMTHPPQFKISAKCCYYAKKKPAEKYIKAGGFDLSCYGVRNTHAAINGKAVKDYNKTQMLNWYNKLWSDGAEYKMWGNGIALPPALYCMQGITDVLTREEDDSWML